MTQIKSNIRNQRGATLAEFLIALLITGIISTAMYQLFLRQHKNYMIQDDITTIQQNARASIDELSRQVRMAGYLVPQGVSAVQASNTNPDTITLSYHVSGCDTYLSDPMPLTSAELKCGTDVSCFEDGQWVYIADLTNGDGEWFQLTAVQTGSSHLQHNTMDLSKVYGTDAVILSMTQVKFYVDNTTDSEHPVLMIQFMGQPAHVYAEEISDLQFQYRLKNGNVVDQPILAADIREVLISLKGRSRTPDPDFPDDPYRERIFSTSVNPRNISN